VRRDPNPATTPAQRPRPRSRGVKLASAGQRRVDRHCGERAESGIQSLDPGEVVSGEVDHRDFAPAKPVELLKRREMVEFEGHRALRDWCVPTKT